MRERGFDFHFPLRVWHIFFIFLLVQLIVSVWRVVIPSLVPHAGQEGSGGSCVCTTSVFTQLSRSAFLPELKPNREPTNTWTVICGARQLSYVHSESFLLDLRSSRSAQLSVNKQLNKTTAPGPPVACRFANGQCSFLPPWYLFKSASSE